MHAGDSRVNGGEVKNDERKTRLSDFSLSLVFYFYELFGDINENFN